MHCTVFVLLAVCHLLIFCMQGLGCMLLAVYATSLFTVIMTQCVCCWLGVALPYLLYAWPSVCAVDKLWHFLINCMYGPVFVLLAVYTTSLITVYIAQCVCCWLGMPLPY